MKIYYSPRIQAPFKTLGFYGIVVFEQRTNKLLFPLFNLIQSRYKVDTRLQ